MDSRFNTQGVGRAGRKASFQTQAREDIPPLPTKPGDLGGGGKAKMLIFGCRNLALLIG